MFDVQVLEIDQITYFYVSTLSMVRSNIFSVWYSLLENIFQFTLSIVTTPTLISNNLNLPYTSAYLTPPLYLIAHIANISENITKCDVLGFTSSPGHGFTQHPQST